MNTISRMARYDEEKVNGMAVFTFYCDISGDAVCVSRPIDETDRDKALETAWNEAKKFFNRCTKCGKWIDDRHYNIDSMMCIDCSPLDKNGGFCRICGVSLKPGANHCTVCGCETGVKKHMEV